MKNSLRITYGYPTDSPTRNNPSFWKRTNRNNWHYWRKLSHVHKRFASKNYMGINFIRDDKDSKFVCNLCNLQLIVMKNQYILFFLNQNEFQRMFELKIPFSDVHTQTHSHKDYWGWWWPKPQYSHLLNFLKSQGQLPNLSQAKDHNIELQGHKERHEVRTEGTLALEGERWPQDVQWKVRLYLSLVCHQWREKHSLLRAYVENERRDDLQ